MATRAEVLAKEVDLAAERALEPESRDIREIEGEHAIRGLTTSGPHVAARRDRRRQTLAALLDHRLSLERDTRLGPDDHATWYEALVANIHAITDQQADRQLRALDQDMSRFAGGGPMAEAVRQEAYKQLLVLRDQALKEAEVLRGKRELEARMPEPPPSRVTLNISHSTVANLNLGTQIGQIASSVEGLQGQGLAELASAIKQLTESIMAAPADDLTAQQQQEAVELVAQISEEAHKPPETRRGAVLRAAGAALGGVVKTVPTLAAGYELLKAALKPFGYDLP